MELEDTLQLTEDARLRLEVTLQSTLAQSEKLKSERDSEENEMRKLVQKKVIFLSVKWDTVFVAESCLSLLTG